jgi:hypothetical protein
MFLYGNDMFLFFRFDEGRSCRHAVKLKGRRRNDAQLINVNVNEVG